MFCVLACILNNSSPWILLAKSCHHNPPHIILGVHHTWIKSLALTKQDEKILLSDQWLTATLINSGQNLLRQRYPNQQGLQDTSYLADRLEWPSRPDSFVQVVFLNGNHWACLSNKFSKEGEVEFFDSLHTVPTSSTDAIVRQACTIMKTQRTLESLVLRVVDIELQDSDSGNCGLYALAVACDLCAGVDPFVVKYMEGKMRQHLWNCFNTRRISSFPSTVHSLLPKKRWVDTFEVDLHCKCRMPESLPMACCDKCGVWYHNGCEDIPSVVYNSAKDVQWLCSECT